MQGDCEKAVGQPKHLTILEKLNMVEAAVSGLELLAEKMDPQPQKPEVPGKNPSNAPPLVMFMNTMPGELMELRDRIAKATDRIKSVTAL